MNYHRVVESIPIGLPPTLVDMDLFFFFGDLFQFIGGIPHHSVEYPTTDIFPIDVAQIGKIKHFLNQSKGFSNIFIAWFQ